MEPSLMAVVAALTMSTVYFATRPPSVQVVEVEKPRPKSEGPVNIDRALFWLAKQIEERGGGTKHPQNAYAVALYGINVSLDAPDELGRYPVQYFNWAKYLEDSDLALFAFAQEMEVRDVSAVPNN